jgi:acetyl esterase/lipase
MVSIPGGSEDRRHVRHDPPLRAALAGRGRDVCDHGAAMKPCVLTLALALAFASATHAQQPPPALTDGQILRLWNGAAPGALGTEDADVPAVTVYLPRVMTASTPAVIICPGGAYRALASNHEGRQVAAYVNSLGMAAFVLRYRLGPRYHHPVELGDAQRAIRLVRSHAAEWRIDPARIGIAGFSAGGHLAMTASTLFDAGDPRAADAVDRAGSRPDFAVLGYPVISLTAPWTHAGSKDNLLGSQPDAALVRRLSGEFAVTKNTPPTFIFQTNADTVVPAENSLHYVLALRQAGVPVEMHLFENGPHGVGLANDDAALAPWSSLLGTWLRGRGVIK